MPRKNKNAGGRRFDTRLTPEQIMRVIQPTPRQKIILLRYMKKEMKDE